MSKFDMFESRKEIRLDSSRVKRKLLVIKTSNQQRKIETRLDLPAVGFEKPAHLTRRLKEQSPHREACSSKFSPPRTRGAKRQGTHPPLRGFNEQLLAREACFVPSSLSPHAGDKECSSP